MQTDELLARLRLKFGESFVNRFPLKEIETYAGEASARYSRRTGCFTRKLELPVSAAGLLQLPEEAERAVAVFDPAGRPLNRAAWPEMMQIHGARWHRETGSEANYFVDDFDEFNQVRIVPVPPAGHFAVLCVMKEGEFDSRVADAVFDYTVSMLLLRDYQPEALHYYDSFTRRTRGAGNSTILPGMLRKGNFF